MSAVEGTMKKSTKKYILNFSLIVIITAIALYFSLKDHFDQVVDVVLNANIWLVGVTLLIVLSYFILEGIALAQFGKLYNRGYNALKGIINALVGGFFNNITPFASGGQFAQAYLFVNQGLRAAEAASVLMLNFIVYQSTMVLYTIILITAHFTDYLDRFSAFLPLILLGFLVNVSVLGALLGASLSTKVHDFISFVVLKFLSKIRIIKDYEASKIKFDAQLNQFKQELTILVKNKKLMFKVFLINVAKLTLFYSVPLFAYKALGYDVGIKDLFDILMMTSAISMITSFIPIPGSSGGAEGVYMLLFTSLFYKEFADPAVAAASTMLIWRLATYYFVTIIGAVTFVITNRSFKRKSSDEFNRS